MTLFIVTQETRPDERGKCRFEAVWRKEGAYKERGQYFFANLEDFVRGKIRDGHTVQVGSLPPLMPQYLHNGRVNEE